MPTTSSELIPVNKQTVPEIIQNNRYYLSDVFQRNSSTFFGTWDIPNIPCSAKDNLHEITPGEEGRWDIISYQYYGTVLYWWVICVANGIRNPLEIKPAGTVVRVPDRETLYTISRGREIELAEYKVF